MYIREFTVRNFLVHQATSVNLHPLTVFVGPNGGGKSALFDATLNFSMLSRGNIRQAFGPYPYSFKATLHHGASNVSRIGFRVVMSRVQEDPTALIYEIDYAQQGSADDGPNFMIFNERLTSLPRERTLFDRSRPDESSLTRFVQLENDRSIFSAIRLSRSPKDIYNLDPLLEYCTQQISRFNKFRLDPYTLAQPSRLPEVGTESSSAVPRLGYHGEDLAATLYYLSETKHPSLDGIRERVREIDPNFQDFEFTSVGTDRIAFAAVYADSRKTVPSVRLSSGMLNFVGLMVLVSTPNRPPVLMIEEPENGLTPQAVKCFYQEMRKLANNANPEERSQVLISSHSPFVICEAWNGDDRDFIHQVKVADGKAKVRKFSDVIASQNIQLARDRVGGRTHLSLANAEEIMSGYLSA